MLPAGQEVVIIIDHAALQMRWRRQGQQLPIRELDEQSRCGATMNATGGVRSLSLRLQSE